MTRPFTTSSVSPSGRMTVNLMGVLGIQRRRPVSRRAPMQLTSTIQTSLTGLQLISLTAQRTG